MFTIVIFHKIDLPYSSLSIGPFKPVLT